MSGGVPIVVEPEQARARPVVVSCPHAGVEIPDEADAGERTALTALVGDGDLFVDQLTVGAEAFGATVVRTQWTRFWVDLNRFADDVSPESVRGGQTVTCPGYAGIRGAVWAVSARGEPIRPAPLSRAAYEDRIARFHAPYHAELRARLLALRGQFGFAILLDLHSMPSSASGWSRPDVVPGTLFGASCAPWLVSEAEGYWRARGRSVRRDDPFAGGAILRTHARPDDGVHGIQLELNRRLYMDEVTRTRTAEFEPLAADVLGFVATLCGLEPS